MSAIPVIGLDGDEAKVADAISRACTEVGFFVVSGHGIDPQVFDAVYEQSAAFFARPAERKNDYPMRTSTVRGDNDYSPYGYSALLAENAFAYAGQPDKPADYVEKFSVGRLIADDAEDLPFPEDDDGQALRTALKTYFAACETVADRIAELLTVALELPRDFFAVRTDSSNDSLRSQFYPGAKREFDNDQGMGEHTDGTFITLLSEEGPGLQVRSLSGEWLDVDTERRDWFVVNIGDLMARWSNDEYVSTPHRVKLASRPRQSIVFFKLANDDALIEAFPKFTRERPAKYEPIRYETFSLQKMNALFGRKDD